MKVVKRILDLEFVEISEIAVDSDVPQVPGRPPPPARPPITEITQWVERFSLMAAVLATRFPDKAPELWAYRLQSFAQNVTTTALAGYHTIANTGEKSSREKTSTGP